MPWVVWWLRPQSVGAHLLQPRSVLEGDPTPSLRLFTGTPHREVAQLEPSPSCPSQTRRSSKPMETGTLGVPLGGTRRVGGLLGLTMCRGVLAALMAL